MRFSKEGGTDSESGMLGILPPARRARTPAETAALRGNHYFLGRDSGGTRPDSR
jgi:hypothetical protein